MSYVFVGFLGFVLTDNGAFSRILWFGNYGFLPSLVITSLGGEGSGRSATVAVYLCVHIMWLHVFLLMQNYPRKHDP